MTVGRIYLYGDVLTEEGKAAGTITPGHLIQNGASGYVVHATAGGNAEKLFAEENSLNGDEITTTYASGDQMFFRACNSGDRVYALLADGQTAVAGSPLESAGDGTLQVHTSASGEPYAAPIVAYATAALDLSASAITAAARLVVRVA